MKAYLKNHRQAPRKMRLVADAVRGKNVAVALNELSVMPQKAAGSVRKLILSAVANAGDGDRKARPEDLVVRTITVDKGATYVRYMPRAFGRATPINRESSHIRVTLANVSDAKAGTTATTDAPGSKVAEKTATTKRASKEEVSTKKEAAAKSAK